jgi:BASS family bile acid:Na+ symporter
MAGVRDRIEAEPWLAAGCIALAYDTNLAFQASGAAVFPGDLPSRMIMGLTLGNKNVGLVWAALGSQVSPLMGLYFAATQLPIFTLPRLAQALLHAHRNTGVPPLPVRSKP